MLYTHKTAREETILAVDAAKLLRKELAREFPGQKFRVRSTRSLSLSVDWIDGPTIKQVEEITQHYAGEGFDGMIDISYPIYHYLTPSREVRICGTCGTVGSLGVVPPDRQTIPPDCEACYLLTNYVLTSRHFSPAAIQRIFDDARTTYNDLATAVLKYTVCREAYANWWIEGAPRGNEILHRILSNLNLMTEPCKLS
ncbi:hypothetical protein KJZ99_12050 [bacterium]|nr:hypothetical protein [bacterium]